MSVLCMDADPAIGAAERMPEIDSSAIRGLWGEYADQPKVYSLDEVASAYIQPTRRIHSVASVDIDELLRDVSVGFGEVVGINTIRGQYSRETPYDEYEATIDTDEREARKSFVNSAILEAIRTRIAKPDEAIETLAETLRGWRQNGVYVVANTAGLPECDVETIRFLQDDLPGCFDAVLFPRNHDGQGPLTKATALEILAEKTGMNLGEMPIAFLDDMEHQVMEAIDTLGTGRLRLYAMIDHAFNNVPDGVASADKSKGVLSKADEFFNRSRLWLPWSFLSQALEAEETEAHTRMHDGNAIYHRAAFAYLARNMDRVWEEGIGNIQSLGGTWHPTRQFAVFKLDQLDSFEIDPLLGDPRLHIHINNLPGIGDMEVSLVDGLPDGARHDHYWHIVSQSMLPYTRLTPKDQLRYAYRDTLYDKRLVGINLPQEELLEGNFVRECSVVYMPNGERALRPTGRCFELLETERRVVTNRHVIEPFQVHATIGGLAATFLLAGNRVELGGPMVMVQDIEPDGTLKNIPQEVTLTQKGDMKDKLLAVG